jgi:triacylglycerol esterase/lipase EstA (alpha/beta hydrolase family)
VRFESNGWPRERLHAIDLPYPLAARTTPGRNRAAHRRRSTRPFLKAEVDKVLQATGTKQVVLVANSRGGYPVRDYMQNQGGDRVSATPSWAACRTMASGPQPDLPARQRVQRRRPVPESAERAEERRGRRGDGSR